MEKKAFRKNLWAYLSCETVTKGWLRRHNNRCQADILLQRRIPEVAIKSKILRTYIGFEELNEPCCVSSPYLDNSVVLCQPSPDGSRWAWIKKCKEKDFVLIVDETVFLIESNVDGPVLNDEVFGTKIVWSEDGRYVACIVDKPVSSNNSVKSTYQYQKSWGERLEKIVEPRVLVFDLVNKRRCLVVGAGLLGGTASVGDPVLLSNLDGRDVKTICTCYCDNRKLGVSYCNNRLSYIQEHSSGRRCSQLRQSKDFAGVNQTNPRFVPGFSTVEGQSCVGVCLVACSNNEDDKNTGGILPHRLMSKIAVICSGFGEDETRLTRSISNESFWITSLPQSPFGSVNSPKGTFSLFFTALDGFEWRMYRCDFARTNPEEEEFSISINPLSLTHCGGRILDVMFDEEGDHILAENSTPASPPSIAITSIDSNGNIRSTITTNNPTTHVDQLSFEVFQTRHYFVYARQRERYLGLIACPHGGPHSVFCNEWDPLVASLALSGWIVLRINYRGSVGWSQEYANELIGHVGEYDVDDCLNTISQFQSFVVNESKKYKLVECPPATFVMGGSHGGFLACHILLHQQQKKEKKKGFVHISGAIIRNPVTNIPALVATSDIPDWPSALLGQQQWSDRWTTESMNALASISPQIILDEMISNNAFDPSLNPPVLFLIGSKDLRVPRHQGINFANTLANAIPDDDDDDIVTILEYPNANHALDGEEVEILHWMETVGEWLWGRLQRAKDDSPSSFLAIDVGASGGKCFVGNLHSGGSLSMREVHRFPNSMVKSGGDGDSSSFVWNTIALEKSILESVKRSPRPLCSMSINTWGVDYVLLDSKNGNILRPPFCHRDPRTEQINKSDDDVFKVLSEQDLYRLSGLQFLPFNTLIQLIVHQRKHPEDFESEDVRLLFMADYFTYVLSNEISCEYTLASTSQMLNVSEKGWSQDICKSFFDGCGKSLLPKIVPPCTRVEHHNDYLNNLPPIVKCASHDTASSMSIIGGGDDDDDDFAVLSLGTCALVGVILKEPILSRDAMLANFSNEGGVDDTIRFLTNLPGMWILQETSRTLDLSFAEMEEIAKTERGISQEVIVFDPNDPTFLSPGDMLPRIQRKLDDDGGGGNSRFVRKEQIIRVIYDSIAVCITKKLLDLECLLARRRGKISTLRVIGGGTRDELMMQILADATSKKVVAGPVEATAIGNILGQAICMGKISSWEEARSIVERSFDVRTYHYGGSGVHELYAKALRRLYP